MKMHVLELFSVNDPGWSQQLVSLVTGFASGEPPAPSAPDLPPAPVAAPPPPAATPPAAPAPVTVSTALPDVSGSVMQRVLRVLSMGVGVTACAIVAVDDARLLATQALTDAQLGPLDAAARAGCALWKAHRALGAGQPLLELGWSGPTLHHLVMPVPRQPGLLILANVEREFGDLSAARWQLAVARNQWI
jgi:hypothetical protein